MKRFTCVLLILLILPVFAGAELSAWFLDVGQGDCTVLICDGEAMVIDGGPPGASQKVYSFLREELQIDHVEYVISTHPHEDHVSGLAAVLNAVSVDLILSPVLKWDSQKFESVLYYAEAQGTPITIPGEGDTLKLGGATVTILHCWPEAWTTNDMSIVTRIDYGDTSLIVTGDAEYMSEYMMIDSGLPLRADVLRLAHHGSTTSRNPEFLEAVSPQYAVISVGKNNAYGHPHQETLDMLKEADVMLFRTDLQGTIQCVSDGHRFQFVTEREGDPELMYVVQHKEAPSIADLFTEEIQGEDNQ